jgi:hypothetical protein
MIEPVSVMSEAPTRAIPKSTTFARPSSSTSTLCGLRSRWTIPCRCANEVAVRIWIVRFAASRGSSAPCSRTISLSVRPRTYSIAMYGVPSQSPRSKMPTMFGCWRPAALVASRRKPSTNSGSSANRRWRNFSAT